MDVRLQQEVKKNPFLHLELIKNEVDKLRVMLRLSKMDPGAKNAELEQLLLFLPSVAHNCSEDVSGDIFTYALDYYPVLEKGLSQALITSLINLKKLKRIGPEVFYKQTIPLVEEMDKMTKTVFLQFLISEIIRDAKHWPLIRSVLAEAVKSGSEAHAKRAAYIFLHLIGRDVWKDAETSEKMFELLLIASASVTHFILLYLLDRVHLTVKEEDIDIPEITRRRSKIKKETKSDQKKKEQEKKERAKKIAKKERAAQEKEPNIVVHLSRMQEKGEKYAVLLFKSLKKAEYAAETKLQMAQVISRVVAYHHLRLKGFLGYMTRFMFPHQTQLPVVFSAIAQAIHQDTPPKEVEAICEVIVNNFCSEHRDDDVISYGINSLRVLIKRYPAASKYQCIQLVLRYRRSLKRKAACASDALRKMLFEAGRAERKLATEQRKAEEECELVEEEVQSDYQCSDQCSQEDSQDADSSSEQPFGFVPEEAISKIRKKTTKEEMVEKAKAEKYKRKSKPLPTSNKEKQKKKNYTVRKTKRRIIPKKNCAGVKRRKK